MRVKVTFNREFGRRASLGQFLHSFDHVVEENPLDRPPPRKKRTAKAVPVQNAFDVDKLGADGFSYKPEWTRGLPLNGPFGPSLARISVCAPLGMDFKIFIVLGWDSDGNPHLDLTLSKEIADGLANQLESSRIVEVDNSELWAPIRTSTNDSMYT